jgi:Domain of unknown function (DUF397)
MTQDLATATWRTSSFSNGGGGNCVEVARLPTGLVAVRDTKDRSRSAQVHTSAAWSAFLVSVKAGEFSRH